MFPSSEEEMFTSSFTNIFYCFDLVQKLTFIELTQVLPITLLQGHKDKDGKAASSEEFSLLR